MAQWKEKEEGISRRRIWKTILKSGQKWSLPENMTEKQELLRSHLWCPKDLAGLRENNE